MTDGKIIPEIDVLVAASVFLIERGVTPYQFSTPRGAGIDSMSVLWQEFSKLYSYGQDIKNIKYSNKGPDIIGVSETEWWQVECKGSGTGRPQTQRTNFDRALASVVSYYCDRPEKLPKRYLQHSDAQPYLGLALPSSQEYLKLLKRRVRKPLRKIINLWILLYEPESQKISVVSPDHKW